MLPFDLQSKLLRVIEEGRFEHVGGLETIEVDVRIIIERCVILSQNNRIEIDEFFELNPKFKSGTNQRPITLREVERAHILHVLEETGWVIEGKYGAATRMDIHPATLRSRMQKLGIKRPRQEI